jgi:hypothetical protein
MELYLKAIDALNRSGIRYVVVGGVAANMHGVQRFTHDLDVIIDFGERSAQIGIQSLLDAGFYPRIPVNPLDFANPTIRQSWIDEKNMKVFSLYDKQDLFFVVDVFVYHPINFEGLHDRSKFIPLKNISVRICSIEDLIELKTIASRPKDMADLHELNLLKNRK